jgi:predicted nuclease of predicted toxin-antitoxin system
VKYLVDANLPRDLARWLASDSDEALYVDDLLTSPATDAEIWDLAARDGLIIVSKDADFAARAVRDERVRVVWIRCGNVKLRPFEAWVAARREAMRRLIDEGERLVELR